jgi:hypothetical protein
MKVFIVSLGVIVVTITSLFTCRTASPEPATPDPQKADNWRVYISPDRSFSVELPCAAIQRNVSATSSPIYEYGCGSEDDSGLRFFSVSVLNMTDAESVRMRDEATFERSVRDSFTPNHKLAKLVPLRIEDGMGREVVVTNTRDEMDNLRGRVILFGSRRYEVGFGASDIKALESPMAERFFSSFKPLK